MTFLFISYHHARSTLSFILSISLPKYSLQSFNLTPNISNADLVHWSNIDILSGGLFARDELVTLARITEESCLM